MMSTNVSPLSREVSGVAREEERSNLYIIHRKLVLIQVMRVGE
jgi:hypothetical protein